MTRPARLDQAGIDAASSHCPDWTVSSDGLSLRRLFTFRNFSEAFGFMARSALAAEKLDHHPDWSNSYKTVSVTLTTHDAGGLTELDFKLARQMDRFAESLSG